MAYGDNCEAYKILTKGPTREQICAAAKHTRGDIAEFGDGSTIELCKWGRHQAYLRNGWNVTPRPDIPAL